MSHGGGPTVYEYTITGKTPLELINKYGGTPSSHDSDDEIENGPRISLESFESKHNSSALSKYYNKREKRSIFSNILVKVGTQTFHLDKVMLALKSNYFEKLFVDDSVETECTEIEIHTIDEETFSSIVEHIYGEILLQYIAINKENYATFFMAMDYLQMKMDLKDFQMNISRASESWSKHNEIPATTLKMYDFVSTTPKFEPILSTFRECFSKNLLQIKKLPDFLSLSPATLVEIISPTSQYDSDETLQYKEHIGKICAEWICHDFHNRLPHIIDLVNAAKYRYGIRFAISSKNYKTFDEPDENKRREMVEKYFYKLLNCSTETISTSGQKAKNEDKPKTNCRSTSVHEIDHEAKWKSFLKHKYFSDVSIRVGEQVFQLHRMKLSLEVPYFNNLFSQSPTQKEYSLDTAIDCVTFKKIVDYIYYEEIDVLNESQLNRLLNTCDILQMRQLSEKIIQHLMSNLNLIKGNIFDFLKYVSKSENFSEFRKQLDTHICLAWDEIAKESKFYEISLDILDYLITLPNLRLKNEQDLPNICAKWIHYDVKNRYKFLPEVALALSRNGMEDYEKHILPLPKDSRACTVKHILQQLNNILSSTQIVSPCSTTVGSMSITEAQLKPCFIVSNDNKITILDANLNEIFSLFSQNELYHVDLSAVVVENNLFVLFRDHGKFSFQVYNLNSKKITSLTFDSESDSANFYLLNCNNSLYFCNHHVLKYYSYKLNRWIMVFKNKSTKYEYRHHRSFHDRHQCYYTSDGKVLFRVFDDDSHNKCAELYNFEKKSWIKYSHIPVDPNGNWEIRDVSIIDEKLSVLFSSCTAIYQQNTRRWEWIARKNETFVTLKQVKDSILYVTRHEHVYSFSIASKSWKLVKKLPGFRKIEAIRSVD